MKKIVFLALILICFMPIFPIKTLKKAVPSKEEQFLATLKKTIEEKKAERIAKLEQSDNPKKRAKAQKLKEKKYLDHIRIVTQDGKTTYLQLADSISGYFDGRSFPYNKQELEKTLKSLCDTYGLTIKDITEIAIYRSTKRSRNYSLFFVGSQYWWTSADLYSAAIFVNTTKKENPSNRELRRTRWKKSEEERRRRRQAEAEKQNSPA